MFRMRIINYLFPVIFLSNCAVINNSFYQTPETVRSGGWKVGLGLGTGIDLTQDKLILSKRETDSIKSFNDPFGDFSKVLLNFQLDLGYGITNRLEADSKLWLGLFGSGARIGLKYRFTPIRARFQYAFIPGISYYHNPGDTISVFGSKTNYMPTLHSVNYEIPIILGIFFSRQVSIYIIPNYTYHQMEITKWFSSNLEKKYSINDFGCTIGLSAKYRSLYVRPEFRYNGLMNNNDFIHAFTGGIGFGLEFVGHE